MATGYSDIIRTIAAEIGHVGADPWIIEGWLRLDPNTGNLRTLDGMSRTFLKREIKSIIDDIAMIPLAEREALAESTMGPRR